MACPRVFFDVTAGGSPVGRVIMEVSFLMFRRNLTIFFKDKSRWALQTNAIFLPVFHLYGKIWFLAIASLIYW